MNSQTPRTYERATGRRDRPFKLLYFHRNWRVTNHNLTSGEDKPIEYNKHCATLINTLCDFFEIQADRRFYAGFFVLLNDLAIFLTYRRGRILTKKTRR